MFQLTEKPIEVAKVRHDVAEHKCGAVVLFEGHVRNHHLGKNVVALEYVAYHSMVKKVLAEIQNEAQQKWELGKISIVHRLGKLEIGEIAVVVAVSSAHRKEAFEACSTIMDELKKRAPIWKKETYKDGKSCWVGCEEIKEDAGNGCASSRREKRSVRHQ